MIEYKSWLTRCIDILDLEVEREEDEEETNLMSGLLKKSGGKCLIYLTLTVQSGALQRVVIVLLCLHTFLILVFKTGSEDLALTVQFLRLGISALFVVEVLARMILLAYLHWEDSARGRSRTLKERFVRWIKRASVLNIADVVLVVLGTTANLMWFFVDRNPTPHGKLTPYIAKGLCVVSATILFILRLLVNSEEATKMFALMKLIIPVMFDLSAIFFIVIYFFASFGETIFTDSVRVKPISGSGKYFTS